MTHSSKIKTAEAPKRTPAAQDVLALYAKNLLAIRNWYRAAPGRGIEVGHYMVGEISAGDNLDALQKALEGKAWQPPEVPRI